MLEQHAAHPGRTPVRQAVDGVGRHRREPSTDRLVQKAAGSSSHLALHPSAEWREELVRTVNRYDNFSASLGTRWERAALYAALGSFALLPCERTHRRKRRVRPDGKGVDACLGVKGSRVRIPPSRLVEEAFRTGNPAAREPDGEPFNVPDGMPEARFSGSQWRLPGHSPSDQDRQMGQSRGQRSRFPEPPTTRMTWPLETKDYS
jgi:hypothetical protein